MIRQRLHADDREAYQEYKSAVVREILAEALTTLMPERHGSPTGSLRAYVKRRTEDYGVEKRAAWEAEVLERRAGRSGR